MSFCPNCGKELNNNPLFCPECGTYLMNAEKEQNAGATTVLNTDNYQQPAQPAYQQPQQAQPVQPTYQQPAQPQAQPVQQQTPYQPPVQQPQQQMPTYNTLPQQQPNNYAGYASAAPVDKPDKASVGLIILSFLLPLVGLIIYFVKRKKQPKAAKAYLTAAVVSVLIASISRLFYNNDKKDDKKADTSVTQDVTVEWEADDTTEAKYTGPAYGAFDSKKYTNEYFDISYTLPENFAFESYSELAETVGEKVDEESGIPYLEKATVKMYYDSAAFSSTTGSSIMTMVVPSGVITSASEMKASELLESVVEGATQSYDNAQQTDMYPLTIAGKKCDAINVGFESEGVKFTATYFALEKDNAYFIAQVITSSYDTKTPQDYIKNFK